MKKTTLEDIKREEEQFIGRIVSEDLFVKPEHNISGYENIKVDIIQYTNFNEWIVGAFYASLVTWDSSPNNPICKDAINLSIEEKKIRLLNILKSRPISVALEMPSFTIKMDGIPRSMTHQIVRHRNMAFGQQSFRVSSCYSDSVRYPMALDDLEIDSTIKNNIIGDYDKLVTDCRQMYKRLIEAGVPMEQARNIMPIGTCTKIVMQTNLRYLIDYIKGRSSQIAQDEHTFIVNKIIDAIREECPEYLEVMKMYIKNL